MSDINKFTPEKIDALNEKTRAELAESVEAYEDKKTSQISMAIRTLIEVTESETHDIEFSGPAGSCTIKVMISPPQKMLEDLFKIGGKAEDAQETSAEDEDRLCEILEYICVEPKIPYDVWKSGQLSDEIPAKIIFELMKQKVSKHEEMVTEIETFRTDKRGAKNPGNKRATKKTTK